MSRFYLKSVVTVMSFFVCLVPSSAPCDTPMSLVIGIDGLGYGPRGLTVAATPNIDQLANGTWVESYSSAFTDQAIAGGMFGTSSLQRTISGPGWTTIHTGVWVDQHNVRDNSFSRPNLLETPSYLEILEESVADLYSASIVNWSPIDTHIISTLDDANSSADFRSTPGTDNHVASVASHLISELDTNLPSAVFIQFDEVDGAGHSCGSTGGCYQRAIELVDARVGRLLSSISNRPNFANENWQVILTSDHGHTRVGGHGGQSTLERQIPFIVSSQNLVGGMLTTDNPPDLSHADVAPTVLDHFDVRVPDYIAGRSRAAGVTNPIAPIATVLYSEDFESLTLGPNVEEDAENRVDAVWTKTPPEGWSIRDAVPGQNEPASNNGVTEWIGWSFADKDWWTEVAGDQNRSGFTRGQGTVAVADPDEWDDEPHPDSAAAGWYSTFMETTEIDIDGVKPGTLLLEFDSSWRPEFDDNYHQTANLEIAFDGNAPVEVFRWESDPASPNFKGDSVNELVRIDVDPPADAKSMVLTFGLFDAGNDWWWAVDNIRVSGALVGDFDQNGSVDTADIDLLTAAMLENDTAFDLNEDGATDRFDRKDLVEKVIGTWFGDANLDGQFDTNDFVTVFQFGKYESGGTATWMEGDFDGDGFFSSSDLIVAFQGGGYEQGRRGLADVPEPSCFLMLMLGATVVVLQRAEPIRLLEM